MKKVFCAIALVLLGFTVSNAVPTPVKPLSIEARHAAKLTIKVKNDTSDEVETITSDGGSYRLQKNIITTIKMDAGDKLFLKDGGKKGRVLLTASADLEGKVQLISKL